VSENDELRDPYLTQKYDSLALYRHRSLDSCDDRKNDQLTHCFEDQSIPLLRHQLLQ
jgi:hypothetical protein